MPKEVTRLRKEGRLQEALQRARQLMEQDPEDIWHKRALAWVYYAFMKQAAHDDDHGRFVDNLNNLSAMQMPADENVLYKNIAWQVGLLVHNSRNMGANMLDQLFELIRDLPFDRQEDYYGFLLRAFTGKAAEWPRYNEFVDWWGLANLRPADYQKYRTETGRFIMSLAEQVYIALAKKVLAPPAEPDRMQAMLAELQALYDQHPDMDYVLYYAAQIMLAMERREEFRSYFLPFLRKKRREFWAWHLYAQAWPAGSDECLACLCRSLMCGAPAKFTGKVKAMLAGELVARGNLAAAKREYQDVLDTIAQEGWRYGPTHELWQAQVWWHTTAATDSNEALYAQFQPLADSLLFANIPEETLVVTDLNTRHQSFGFVLPGPVTGHASYKKLAITPQPGDVYRARLKQPPRDKPGHYVIYTMSAADDSMAADLRKQVSGPASLVANKNFAFIDDVFVPPYLVQQAGLQDGDSIEATAVKVYNKKKKAWGWQAVRLRPKKA